MNCSAQTVIIGCVFVVAFWKEQRNYIINEYKLAFCESEREQRPYAAGVEIYVHTGFFTKIWEIEVQPERNENDIFRDEFL